MPGKKVMVLRTDRLGDLVLCSGYLHNLVESRPEDQFELWVAPDMLPVKEILHPRLSLQSLPFDRYLQAEDDVFRQWLAQIDERNYDELITPQFTLGYPEVLALAHVSVPRRWGFANWETGVHPGWISLHVHAPGRAMSSWITDGPQVDAFSQECTKYDALAACQGLTFASNAPRLAVTGLDSIPKQGGVLVWPGAGAEERRWPLERFSATVAKLGLSIVTIGAAPAEHDLALELKRSLNKAQVAARVCLRQPSELAATARWLAGFRRVLTNDTGIAHLGAASGCTVVSISPSQYQGRFSVCGKSALTIFAKVPCARCSSRCLFDSPLWPCVAEIDTERVAAAIGEFSGGCQSIFLDARSFPSDSGLFQQLHVAGQRRSQTAEASAVEWSQMIQNLRKNLGTAEAQVGHWQSLFSQAEEQRDNSQRLLSEAEAQRKQWQALFRQAEAQRDNVQQLFSEAEAQRNQWQALFRQAEAQRDNFQRLLGETEAQRNQWQALFGEAETQRDNFRRERDVLLEQLSNADQRYQVFHNLFPWATGLPPQDITGDGLKISIVTPSFQQGRFIEETIRSVLDQRYPNFEHIIVDAGSTDQTISILKKYPHLHWVSEKDLGQAHAINKGLLMSSGDIVAYLNSDDVYRPQAFQTIARYFEENPSARMVVGDCDYINESSETTGHLTARYEKFEDLVRYWGWDKWYCLPQQAVFLRRDVLSEVGLFDIRYQMVMDLDMWLRIAQITSPRVLSQTLAAFRLAPDTKTVSSAHRMYAEEFQASRRYWKLLPARTRLAVALQARRHLSGKYLDVAEHFAFSNQQRKLAAELAAGSLSNWPPRLASPRLLMTLLQLGTMRLPAVCGPVRVLHRQYLDFLWNRQQRAAAKASS
jgi:glycosyltransferase involved in cell wall biosynthesis/ADP-heptose:LPS heptosyltransferase